MDPLDRLAQLGLSNLQLGDAALNGNQHGLSEIAPSEAQTRW
ncbi:MAG: hypothetical protein AAGF01_26960 [Cyanobacteria bacterium P01_G01_bin.38]